MTDTTHDPGLREAFEHVLAAAQTGAFDSVADPPRPRLAGLVDEDLLGVLHACDQIGTLAQVVAGWAAAEVSRRHPPGWATSDPILGSVKVPQLPVRGAERHDLDAAFHAVATGVLGPDELPVTIIAILTRIRDLFTPSARLSLPALDVQGIPRTDVVRYDPADLTAKPATYSPPKGP